MMKKVLTIPEGAQYLSCSSRTLYRLIDEKEIPGFYVRGRSLRILVSDLDSYIERQVQRFADALDERDSL
ncbi:DNA-binding protein [Desulfobacteraceae bacterium SEEP-SAG9]|nr:DNA-binding protein [Desulfobacteraceae bacterium SEEP-SAG9]